VPILISESKETLGFVPTMGALHAGHLSLIRKAVQDCDEVVVSIFVNPAQFGEGEDFERYPRSLEADREAALAAGANYVYAPVQTDIYPNYPQFDIPGEPFDAALIPGPLAVRWEGEKRPGHFEGVTAVVKRLFDLIQPDKAYFGEKDFQQLRVIESMVKQLALPVEIVRCPILRDEAGLALSSRNRYLSDTDYQQALTIPRALAAGDQSLLSNSIVLDYFAEVDAETLEPALVPGKKGNLRIFAGTLGTTRLIDNCPV